MATIILGERRMGFADPLRPSVHWDGELSAILDQRPISRTSGGDDGARRLSTAGMRRLRLGDRGVQVGGGLFALEPLVADDEGGGGADLVLLAVALDLGVQRRGGLLVVQAGHDPGLAQAP